MLSNRTQIVLAYIRGVSEGTMKQDPEILRMISGLMAGLPVEEAEEFREEFLTVRFSRSTRPSFSLSPSTFHRCFGSLTLSLPLSLIYVGVCRRPTYHLPRQPHQIPTLPQQRDRQVHASPRAVCEREERAGWV